MTYLPDALSMEMCISQGESMLFCMIIFFYVPVS